MKAITQGTEYSGDLSMVFVSAPNSQGASAMAGSG